MAVERGVREGPGCPAGVARDPDVPRHGDDADRLLAALREVARVEKVYAFDGRNAISDGIHTALLNMLERLIFELRQR
jgi:hypothetical protein